MNKKIMDTIIEFEDKSRTPEERRLGMTHITTKIIFPELTEMLTVAIDEIKEITNGNEEMDLLADLILISYKLSCEHLTMMLTSINNLAELLKAGKYVIEQDILEKKIQKIANVVMCARTTEGENENR